MSYQAIHVPVLQAVRFDRPVSSGRTKPCLVTCADPTGREYEVVLKPRGAEMSGTAMICELLAALFARDMGLAAPTPVIVDIAPGFHACVTAEHPEHRHRLQASNGLNYGSIHLGAGVATWPAGRTPPAAMLPRATEVFAFDAIILNPDRRRTNPNLLHRRDEFFVYDHELAFSLLYALSPEAAHPWCRGALRFLVEHVFFSALRGKSPDWGPFMRRLDQIPDSRFASYLAALPPAWHHGNQAAERIVSYLIDVKSHVDGIALNLAEVLA